MQYLIHYTLILTLTVLGVSVFQWLKNERKYAIWVGLLFVLGLEAGTRMFLTDNLGHNVALHAFDFTGIFIVMGTATLLALTSLIIWFRTKKVMPWLIITILAALQVLVSLYLWSNFSVFTSVGR